MRLDKIQGPGVDGALIEHLRSWGIENLTEIQERSIGAGVADGQSMILTRMFHESAGSDRNRG